MGDLVQLAKRRAEEVISFMGVNVDVEASETTDGIILTIAAVSESARLIGRHGETLRAIEYLVGQMVKAADSEAPRVLLDIAGYRESRRNALEVQAREAAERVIDSGNEVAMPPMNPAERRMVHMALQEMEGITTESRGEGRARHLVVKPA